MVVVYIRRYLISVPGFKFLILHIIWIPYIYVNKDVRIHGYFSKPKGLREQKSLGNTGLYGYNKITKSLGCGQMVDVPVTYRGTAEARML